LNKGLKAISGKINICFFVGSLQTGGAENHVLKILENIDRDKYNPYVCVFLKEGQYLKDLEKLKVPIMEYRFRRFHLPGFFFHQAHFIRFLIKARIHLVHVHLTGCFIFALTAAFIAKTKTKIISWHNTYSYPYGERKPLQFKPTLYSYIILKYSAILSHKIVAVSERVKKMNCSFYNIDPEKVTVIHNGIDFSQKKADSKPDLMNAHEKDKPFTIGTVGSLIPQKGHRYLIEAIEVVQPEIPNLSVLIVGDGPLKDDLINETEKRCLQDAIKFLGWRNDVPELLRGLDLWVMPSLHEGFSIALLEAMAAKRPIIATDAGGNAEAIQNKENGLLIQSQSVKELADAILYFFKNPEERIRMGVNAQRTYQKGFTANIMSRKFDALYSTFYQ